MKDELFRKFAQEVAKETVSQILNVFGLDEKDAVEFRKDFVFLRSRRNTSEAIKGYFLKATIGIGGTGLAALLLIGIKEWVK